MSKVIFLTDHRSAGAVGEPPSGAARTKDGALLDARHRPLRDLRISVTDRCNFRCTYCMPREVFDSHYAFMPHSSLLSFAEIARVAAVAVQSGVRKLRLTGGVPDRKTTRLNYIHSCAYLTSHSPLKHKTNS